jgi:hypothetical protein
VKWVRRGRPSTARSHVTTGDGLDATNWELLQQSVTAAHQGNAEAHIAALRRLEREVPVDATVGVYLWYLLRYQVAELLGRRPAEKDLHDLAEHFYSEFAKLIRGDRSQLENMLLTVFEFAPENKQVKGGRAVVLGSAALGVLLDDPETELAAMRPHLEEWWRHNVEEFRELGVD